jgi:hypothetical protein
MKSATRGVSLSLVPVAVVLLPADIIIVSNRRETGF